jgi:hypothetical protein
VANSPRCTLVENAFIGICNSYMQYKHIWNSIALVPILSTHHSQYGTDAHDCLESALATPRLAKCLGHTSQIGSIGMHVEYRIAGCVWWWIVCTSFEVTVNDAKCNARMRPCASQMLTAGWQ